MNEGEVRLCRKIKGVCGGYRYYNRFGFVRQTLDVVNDRVRQQITDTLNQKLETVELSVAVKVTGGSGIICLFKNEMQLCLNLK